MDQYKNLFKLTIYYDIFIYNKNYVQTFNNETTHEFIIKHLVIEEIQRTNFIIYKLTNQTTMRHINNNIQTCRYKN